MKKNRRSILGFIVILFAVFIAGCAGNNEEDQANASTQETALSDSGVLILKVNPEIAIKYNKDGVVTDIQGENDDGKAILDNYKDYIGKESSLVLEELVGLINEAGYFVEEIEGEPKRIVLELEEGSALPDDQFLEEMAINVQNAIANLDVKTNVVTTEEISLEEAKQIAFDHAGVKAEDAVFDDQELDTDDGNKIYELEFYVDGVEYEYDIHAETGEILKSERDQEDDKKEATAQKTQAAQTTNETSKKQQPKKQQPKKQEAQKTEYISMDQAKNIAFKHAGVNGAEAHFDDQEFDIDDGVPHYELEFYVNGREYEYDIHAVSGKILKAEKENKQAQKTKPVKQSKPAAKPSQITKDEAINIALNHAGFNRSQVAFDDIELDKDDGRLVWEVEFDVGNWEYEYEIDAFTKTILDFEKELDD